jgi:hypothetical protein
MAREPRVARRMIAKSLIDLYTHTPDDFKRIRYFRPLSDNGPFYVFLSLPQPDSIPMSNIVKLDIAYFKPVVWL